jgi:hypothetical protein
VVLPTYAGNTEDNWGASIRCGREWQEVLIIPSTSNTTSVPVATEEVVWMDSALELLVPGDCGGRGEEHLQPLSITATCSYRHGDSSCASVTARRNGGSVTPTLA